MQMRKLKTLILLNVNLTILEKCYLIQTLNAELKEYMLGRIKNYMGNYNTK